MKPSRVILALALLLAGPLRAQEHHHHPAPEKLGRAHLATSCSPAVTARFDRALALLHSFAYSPAERAFLEVAAADPHCAMAWWGAAMTNYHQLWAPPSPTEFAAGAEEVKRAAAIHPVSPREEAYIAAVGGYFSDPSVKPDARARRYAAAMGKLARTWPKDEEAQVFFALALIATQSPTDRTFANDKRAAAILEPIWKRQPQHPGVPHYLIHAYDSAELAPRGLPAARAYSRIAPSAPHALHMPSHIFTRLGLWDDSIASNRAAIAAARAQGDLGEQLHAMDYLTYALLQRGRWREAAAVVSEARSMTGLPAAQFKFGYAANAMPVRYAIERGDWAGASALQPLPGTPASVAALVHWARAVGHSRAVPPQSANADIADLAADLAALRAAHDDYWAVQTDVMLEEARAWQARANGDHAGALALLAAAADQEDAVEKLPVTPGPIVPAREQLGEMLLAEHRPAEALRAFRTSLTNAPGRRGSLIGGLAAARAVGDTRIARRFEASLRSGAQETP